MITQVDHQESWTIRLIFEEGDDWPERLQVTGTKTRFMRPQRMSAFLRRDDPHIHINVYGEPISDSPLKPETATSRYELHQAPEWIQVLVTQVREQRDLGPGRTGIDW